MQHTPRHEEGVLQLCPQASGTPSINRLYVFKLNCKQGGCHQGRNCPFVSFMQHPPRQEEEVLQLCPHASRAPRNGCVCSYMLIESGEGVTQAKVPLLLCSRNTPRARGGGIATFFPGLRNTLNGYFICIQGELGAGRVSLRQEFSV